jgi:hypothetical protein
VRNGFEVGVHDLKHDGRLYWSRREFKQRAARINHYLAEWGAVGFRSAFMLRKLDWLHELGIGYDASSFDTDPFEPQPERVPNPSSHSGCLVRFRITSHNSRVRFLRMATLSSLIPFLKTSHFSRSCEKPLRISDAENSTGSPNTVEWP